ncbi:MAG: serine hydrolase [Alphaproteobacteria bacterium]|nr:serine hydrolase [Alphaproteobacteria bacterium]
MPLATIAIFAGTLITTNPAPEQSAQAAFDAVAGEFPSINATVMVEGEIVWEAAGGVLRQPGNGPDQDYNVYSVAKMLTGMAYLHLVAEGEITLDRPVRDIDPDLPESFAPVTLRHLLTHTSGIRHYVSDQDWIDFSNLRCDTPADAVAYFAGDRLTFDPGMRTRYSTFGFVLLSHLLFELTGAPSYDAAMTEVLGDVYLARTDSVGADKAENFHRDREPSRAGDWFVLDDLSAECKFGGGGLLASSRDLAAMGQALTDGSVADISAEMELLQPGHLPSGEVIGTVFGMTVGFSDSMQVHYALHSGGSPGGRSFIIVLLEPQVSVAITANADGEAFTDLAIRLARLFAGFPETAD